MFTSLVDQLAHFRPIIVINEKPAAALIYNNMENGALNVSLWLSEGQKCGSALNCCTVLSWFRAS